LFIICALLNPEVFEVIWFNCLLSVETAIKNGRIMVRKMIAIERQNAEEQRRAAYFIWKKSE
jgi:hypothetical protein